MEVVQNADYKDFKHLIIQQYQDSLNLKGIIDANMNQANDLESAMFKLRDEFWVDTAVGVQLDVIGTIHDQPRNGNTDEAYRNLIKSKIIINSGSGQPETIITALSQLYGATIVQLIQDGNATLYIFTDILLTDFEYKSIERIVPAGVEIIAIVFTDGTPFVFDGDDNGLGLGSIITAELTLSSGDTLVLSDGSTLSIYDNISDDTAEAGEFSSIITGV